MARTQWSKTQETIYTQSFEIKSISSFFSIISEVQQFICNDILICMRIGIDCRLWNETGVGRYIRNLVGQLQEIDKENEYVLFIKRGDFENVKYQMSNVKCQIVGTDIHWHSVKEQTSFAQELNKHNLDLMHFPYFSLPILYRRPFVVTIHDLIFHQFSSGKASTLPLPLFAMKREGFKIVFKHALTKSQKIIVPLDCVKQEIISQFHIPEKKMIVTKEGFDSSLLRTTDASDVVKKEVEKGKYFLYVGNAYPHKNVEFLLQGFSTFHAKHPEYRLVLVIKKDIFLKELRGKFDEGYVSYLSDLSDADLGYLYKNATAFVSASLMEGFGLPPLEALALGTQVILSDIPSFREVCGENAFYFNPRDEGSLVQQLEKVSTLSEKEKDKKIKQLRSLAEQYSWEKMAEETLKAYKAAV